MALGVGLSAIISVGVGEAAAGDEQAAATATSATTARLANRRDGRWTRRGIVYTFTRALEYPS